MKTNKTQEFCLSLYALNKSSVAKSERVILDRVVSVLDDVDAFCPLPLTFEESLDRLQSRAKAYVEPDGSFVLAGSDGPDRFEIGGMVIDQGTYVAYVDFIGHGPSHLWLRLFQSLIEKQQTQELPHELDDPLACHAVFLKPEGCGLTVGEFLRIVSDG